MLFSTNEQAYIPFLYEVVTSWLYKCIQCRIEVLIQTSQESLLLPVFGALCFCARARVINCADSDHFCRWFSGLRFVDQIMSQ